MNARPIIVKEFGPFKMSKVAVNLADLDSQNSAFKDVPVSIGETKPRVARPSHIGGNWWGDDMGGTDFSGPDPMDIRSSFQ